MIDEISDRDFILMIVIAIALVLMSCGSPQPVEPEFFTIEYHRQQYPLSDGTYPENWIVYPNHGTDYDGVYTHNGGELHTQCMSGGRFHYNLQGEQPGDTVMYHNWDGRIQIEVLR